MRRILLFLAIVGVLNLASLAHTHEIDFVEDYALADDRGEVLKRLIPGSEPFYYYQCLHRQTLEEYDEVESLLKEWAKRHGQNERYLEIVRRQALLTYPQQPQKSLAYLRDQLGLHFNHQREQLDRKPQLPTQLDPAKIDAEQLTQRLLRSGDDLAGFTNDALSQLARLDLNPIQRRTLLTRLQFPDVDNLAELIVADLNHKGSRGFGAMQIHRQLTLEQLEECLTLKSDLLNQENFVSIYLPKLQPIGGLDWRYHPQAKQAYLDRLWSFVSRLSAVHNSLKTHVLYQQLELDRAAGKFSRQLFLQYIELPRQAAYANVKNLQQVVRGQLANLDADYAALTLLPPIGNDEPLVRSYLSHFFVKAENYREFEPYIDSDYLKFLFAETKIVQGVGDAEQWYAMLPPGQLQALRDRVDLDFVATNAAIFAADDKVSLDLLVKNVRTLIVKVYEINTENFYRENLREVNTDINLDGLVANFEETRQYDDPPLRQIQRHFEFPQLEKPGVYVVDFIGNGMSSRAVVRKGQHRFLVRNSPAGQVLTILDETNQKIDDAKVWLGGREYSADAEGRIQIPFSTSPGQRPLVISHNSVASLHQFDHRGEQYELAAGFYVDRESLLQHEDSAVLLRTGLKLNGTPVSLSLLQNVQLTILSTDLDGLESIKEIRDCQIFEDRETLQAFHVPPRLASITFRLTSQVEKRFHGRRCSARQ